MESARPGGPLHTKDRTNNAADAEGRYPARASGPEPGPSSPIGMLRDTVAPQPRPRGYVLPW
ncbi:hypothetical protein GCM10009647_015110 [Streptomyces sanglieri]